MADVRRLEELQEDMNELTKQVNELIEKVIEMYTSNEVTDQEKLNEIYSLRDKKYKQINGKI